MAERVRGVVFRAGKSKFGFYIKLDGDDTFYNTKYEPKVGEGDEIGIEFDRKGRSCNIKNVKVFSKADRAPRGNGSGNGSGGYQPAGGDRQDSIVWQSSRKDAIEMAALLLTNGAVTMPKTANDRAVIVDGLVNKLTYRYFLDASNPRGSDTFKEEAGVEADAQPDGDGWDEQPSPADEAPWGEETGGNDDVQWD